MDFKFLSTDHTHNNKQYSYVFPTSSSSYTYFSDQPMTRQPLPLHGEEFSQYSVTVPMMSEERYGGGGYDHHRYMFRRRLPALPEIEEIIDVYQPQGHAKDIIVLPSDAGVSGSKRKTPTPSSPTAAGSSGLCSKKIIEEWRCAVCDISATCERGLKDHLAGKKHMAKVEALKGNNTGADIGLGVKKQTPEVKSLKGDNTGGGDIGFTIIKNKQITSSENNNVGDIGLGIIKSSVKNQTSDSKKMKMSSDGGRMRKKFKFWCKICKTGAYDEIVMKDHKKGKKHMKNRRMMMKARAQKRSFDRKGI